MTRNPLTARTLEIVQLRFSIERDACGIRLNLMLDVDSAIKRANEEALAPYMRRLDDGNVYVVSHPDLADIFSASCGATQDVRDPVSWLRTPGTQYKIVDPVIRYEDESGSHTYRVRAYRLLSEVSLRESPLELIPNGSWNGDDEKQPIVFSATREGN